ncbi:MAG: diguanylate cyclase [Clostridia bacterium]|nr:diguanylate cyclase [Clostridia bacterium]
MRKLLPELKMRHKLFIMFLVAALIPIIAASFFMYMKIERSLDQIIKNNTENTVNVMRGYLDNKANDVLDLAEGYAENHDLVAALEQDNRLLLDYRITPIYNTLKREENITGFEFYDSNGRLYTQAQKLGVYGHDKSKDVYITGALNGKKVKGYELENNELLIKAAVPVRILGKIIGVCQMKLKFTDKTFSDMNMLLSQEIDIYSINALILSSKDNQRLLKSSADNLEVFKRVVSGELVKTHQGNTVKMFYPLNDVNGNIIAIIGIKEDISQLNNSKREFFYIFVGIFFCAIILSTVISFVISNKITKPIVFVAKSLSEIAQGTSINREKRIAVTSKDEIADLINAFNQIQKLEQENIKRMKETQQKLKTLAELDGLTGAYNRRFFNEYYELEVRRVLNHKKYNPNEKSNMNFGIAILDIDNFKKINDTYGHLVGDNILKQVVEKIREVLFTKDIICRYGGEEFIVIFTRTAKEGVIQAAEKIRSSIAESKFYFSENYPEGNITVSIGTASFEEDSSSESKDILKVADDRLLAAKAQGKNRVVHESLAYRPAGKKNIGL